MAPGLNGCQSGNVPKNKSKTRNRAAVREVLALAASLPWESPPETDRRRKPSSSHSEADQDHIRPSRVSASSGNLVDNDNGELSWELNHLLGSSPSYRPVPRGARNRPVWMSGDQPSGPGSLNGAGGSGRSNPPNRYQVVTKLASIKDYIEQTEVIMRELRASDTPGCKEQHDKLVEMLADLRDSESKLEVLLRSMDQVDARIDRLLTGATQVQSSSPQMNGDAGTEEQLHRQAEEHNRKVDALEKQRQELLDLQQLAQRKLAEAEAERARLLNRATSFNTEAIAGTSMEANLQNLTERLRNVQRVCEEQNRMSEALDRSTPAEHPDEDQAEAELSDTETDYQLVRDKVAELNAIKGQLSQLQNMMAVIEAEHDGSDDSGRRSQPRDMQKVERVVGQIAELNRLVETVRHRGRDEEECRPQLASLAQPRLSEEVSVETMQQMTRDLEEQTARMKRERDCLLQARNDLQNMARLARGRVSSSADDSESEPPSLLPANITSTPRNVEEDSASRSGGRKSNDSSGFRAPPRVRQRATWNQSLPTLVNVNQDTLDRRRKEPRSSQSSLRNGEGEARARTEGSDWSPDLLNPDAMYHTQSQLEESAQLCEQMLQDSVGRGQLGGGPGADLTSILYSQQQMLTRTVSHCCKLIWLQQRQINELRNALILQQSTSLPSQPTMSQQQLASQSGAFACVHPSLYPHVPPRDFSVNSQAEKPNDAPAGFYVGFPDEAIGGNRPIPQQNPANQAFDPILQDFRYRSRGFNANVFATRPGNVDMGVPPNNQVPPLPPVMACFSPEEMGPPGALNNQVPPGNRANNYWDNFRSYSRQNLLSTSKSNENSDPLRRAGTRQASNQERTPHAIVPPNNQSHNPVGEVQPLRQTTQGNALTNPMPHPSNHSHIVRSRSAEPQSLRNLGGVKNMTCEVAARREDSDANRGRNKTGTGAPNCVVTDPWMGEHPEDSLTRVRNDTGGARNRIRTDPWEGAGIREDPEESQNRHRNIIGGARNRTRPVQGDGPGARDNSDESLTRVRNNTDGARNRIRAEQWEGGGLRDNPDENRVRNNTRSGCRNRIEPDPVEQPPDPAIRSNNGAHTWNLNNRTAADSANSLFTVLRLPTSVYQEVTNFIRANEARPNFLIQLFRDLQQVTSDPQRQRALQSLQEVVGPNNIVLEARNNMRHENRSNLNRHSDEAAVDRIFHQLRDNQNTIRQNLGSVPLDIIGSNLENPNISNIRELSNPTTSNPNPNPRNNIDHNQIRDFQSYFEGNFCNVGPGSSLKNPNLSNIRENLTEGSLSEYERMNPKNVYLSLYDSLVEDLRRRSAEEDFVEPFEEDIRPLNFDEGLFLMENRHSARFDLLEGREIPNRRESFTGCENFENEPRPLDGAAGGAVRKRGFLFSDMNEERTEEPQEGSSILRSPEWHPAENPFTMFVRPMSQLGPFQGSGVLQADDADLAEADQTRSADGSESLCVYLNRLTTEVESELPEELQTEESPTEDTQGAVAVAAEPLEGEVGHPLEADPNENKIPNESNNNVSKQLNVVKNNGVKVAKTRLQEAFSAAMEPERPENTERLMERPITPMMDMAGALEHLIDFRRPREESSPYHRSEGFQDVEVDAEREAGLDQVPTRLEKGDALEAERDEHT